MKGLALKERHDHDYRAIELYRIVDVQKKYNGSSGDRAFLFRKCKCEKRKVFEYGSYKSMVKLHKTLTKKAENDE